MGLVTELLLLCFLRSCRSQGPDRMLQDCLNRQQQGQDEGHGHCIIRALATNAKVWLRMSQRIMTPQEKCTVQGLLHVEGLSQNRQSELAGQSMNVASVMPALVCMKAVFTN